MENYIIESVKKALYIAIAGLLFMYLALNIVASQAVSPLYFGLTRQETDSAVSFLQYIKTLPEFFVYKNRFSAEVLEKFNLEESRQASEILRFEQMLQQNPFYRDALYNLSLLYSQIGQPEKAQEYLRRAQEVDPNLK